MAGITDADNRYGEANAEPIIFVGSKAIQMYKIDPK
jgi:hypothetical protein